MTGRQDHQMGTMDDDEPVEVVSTALAAALPMQPPTAPLPDRTLADLLAEVILRGKSPQTRKAYRADLEDFLVWLLGRSVHLPAEPDVLRLDPVAAQAVNAALAAVQRVTEADINAYLRHLAGEGGDGMQPATLNRRLTPLRLLFARLHRYHLIAVNPMEFIKSRRLSNVSPTLWLSRQEARALEEACVHRGQEPSLRDLRDRALIVFMLATGVRSAEVLSLAVADLGQVDGHHVAWIIGKGGARERVKVSPRAWKTLATYLDAAGIHEGHVFRRLRRLGVDPTAPHAPRAYRVDGPLAYTGLKFILRERFKVAGLSDKLSPHSLRHSFVTLALRGGATLPMVQAAARHASPQTTIRYAHGLDDLDNNAVDYVNW
ncbi:MAG: tyrosine-type recombinase/integrase [Chloroflexota bacterium]|nr:tyrosine-type recombinase/integrase [Chloroflexota bacterium]